MDKLESHEWESVFSEASQREVFRNDRYAEVETFFKEPGFAQATLSTISTPGMSLIQASFQSTRKLVLVDPENVESVSSSFVLDGELESQFDVNKSSVHHQGHTHGFQYTPNFKGQHILHNCRLQALSLVYDTAYFKSLAQSAGSGYLDKVLTSMEKGEPLLVPPGKLLLQPRMAELLQQIRQCSFQGLTRYLFLEAKMLELFALQMDQLNTGAGIKEAWSPADRERLKAVHDFIGHHYLDALTLSGLCTRFGLNEFKLKKGYKHFFGSTVFGHIHELRMQTALQLLLTGQMNVSEASLHIGYNNISSFSGAFKKNFGYLPGKIRAQRNSLYGY